MLPLFARADGLYTKIGDYTKPQLPYQRALIACRNGQETMVVSSELKGPSGDYAWIVPLPKPPSMVRQVDSAGFDRLPRRYSPQYGSPSLDPPLVGLAWLLLILAFAGALQPKRTSALIMFLVFVVALVLFPVYAQPKFASKSVERISSMVVGDYKIDVVRSQDPSTLSTWLRLHGGRLPVEAEPIIAQYVKEGWCFAVASLDRTTGQGSPHPLAFTFPSKQAIYPMRLTAAQGNRTIVDLFIVSDGTPSVDHLRVWRSLRLSDFNYMKNDELLESQPAYYVAWPGAKITRLRGELNPADMKFDLVVKDGPFSESRIRVATKDGFSTDRLGTIVGWMAAFCAPLSFLGCLLQVKRRDALVVLGGVALAVGCWSGFGYGKTFAPLETGLMYDTSPPPVLAN